MGEGATEQKVFEYIVRYKGLNDGASPSYRQIASACGVALGSVRYWLDRLEDAGKIYRDEGQYRAICVPGGRWVFEGAQQQVERSVCR